MFCNLKIKSSVLLCIVYLHMACGECEGSPYPVFHGVAGRMFAEFQITFPEGSTGLSELSLKIHLFLRLHVY